LKEVALRLAEVADFSGRPLADDSRYARQTIATVFVPTAEPPQYRLLIGELAGGRRLFSDDLALLESAALTAARRIDAVRVVHERCVRDLHEEEMRKLATEAELRALRAQINPHFLFNALNAIAGLIHKDPAVADRTIEQLADVFRYALRGGENEWALLDEELEFVRSYLEVERARFGSRLNIDVRLDDDVRGARVPTMMVQTLVENAVKHGVALVRGPASVEVHARRDGGQLVITVADSGPGFPDNAPPKSTFPWSSTSRHAQPHPQTKSGGYGLANIRQRLEGYFGSNAALTVSRDAERRRTIVSVSLPLELHVVRHTAARESRS
jgi:LytS/YehU family sensor histidine kinase